MKHFGTVLLICWMAVCFSFPAAAENGGPEYREEPAAQYEETVRALRDAGIAIPEETAAETKAWIEERGLNRAFFASFLLSRVGWGVYDYDTYTWTPTSSDVYAFDCEIFNIEKMYTDFLQGVASIVPGFAYTDVEESLDETDGNGMGAALLQELLNVLTSSGRPLSEGTKFVSFRLNGHLYQKELAYYGDWFNEDAIDWINRALEAEEFSGRLYSFPDDGQGLILIYGGPEKAEAVRRVLGI